MSVVTGTGRLVRLALRRDRIKLPIWILATVLLVATTIPAVKDLYAESAQERIVYATTTASSMVSRVFGGPIAGPDIGSIVMNESYLTAAVLVAFMSTLAIVRHTRQNEETGRAELIGSAVVGRYAGLVAALIVAMGANIIVGSLVTLSLIGGGLDKGGSIATGAALAGTGIAFAALAAVAAQLSENARGANSLAAIAIGAAFLLRGIGDGIGTLAQNGMAISSAWPSYLSPLGWGQQMHPYVHDRWWLLALFPLFTIVSVGVAFYLTSHRDVGSGILSTKPGPAQADPNLLSPLGLAWRLQKGVLRGWAVGILIMGVVIGLVVEEFKDMLTENPSFAQAFGQMSKDGSPSDVLIGAMIAMTSMAIAAYTVQALQRMRTEEANGQLEPVLATSVSRPRWALSHITWTLLGAVGLVLIMGASAGVTYVLSSGAAWSEVWRLTGASLVHLAGVVTMAGFAVMIFGLIPRATIAVTWSAFGISMVIVQFGPLLKLPQWIINLSPFTHLPSAPAEAVTLTPIISLSLIGLVFGIIGLIAFRRRDLAVG